MPCPLCGDICRCSSHAHSAAHSIAPSHAAPETPAADAPCLPSPAEGSASSQSNESVSDDSPAWRQEVAARLSRYQARRKPRPPRYPSLRLRFEEENHCTNDHPIDDHRSERDSTRPAGEALVEPSAFSHRLATVSNQALALDGFADCVTDAVELPAPVAEAAPAAAVLPGG